MGVTAMWLLWPQSSPTCASFELLPLSPCTKFLPKESLAQEDLGQVPWPPAHTPGAVCAPPSPQTWPLAISPWQQPSHVAPWSSLACFL